MRRYSIGFVLVAVMSCSSPTTTTPPPGNPALRPLIGAQSVGAGGGVLRYSGAGDPLNGLTLTVPAGAYATTSLWTIVADSTIVIPLPAGFTQVGPALAISTDQAGYAAGPITLKVPMVVGAAYGVAPFYYNPSTGKFEGIPMVDLTTTYATLAIENFATASTTTGGPTQTALRTGAAPTVVTCDNLNGFGGICIVWVKVADALLQGTFTSNFLPGRDDWEFVNNGDYVSPEGDCEGMSISALYYHFFVEGSSGLYHQYAASPTNLWANVQGIRFAGSVQGDYVARSAAGFNQIGIMEDSAGANAANTDPVKALTSNWLMMTFQLTQQPVLMTLRGAAAGHAVIAYAGTQAGAHTVISFADPNYPGVARTMIFDAGVLTPVSLKLRATAGSSSFDRAYAVSVSADLPVASIAARWVEFKRGTAGADRYPSQYSWAMYDYVSSTTYITMPAVVQTPFNKFLPALLCPGCPAKIAGITPVDRQAVAVYDATGANQIALDGAGQITLTPGSTTFVLEATPKSPFSPALLTGFLDSRSVTVIYTPGTYALNVLTAPLNVVVGSSSTDVLQLKRVNYLSPITITAVSDSGITITPSETPSPNYTTTLTVNMPSSVVLGSTHIVTVTGTAVDLAPVLTSFAVVAVATPAMALSLQTAPISLPAGNTSLPDNVTIIRTNLSDPVTLSGVGDNGITVNVTTQPGTGNVGTFTVTVPSTLPPNTYNVTLTATTGAVTTTTSFAVIVQPVSTYTMSVQTAPLTVVQGTTSGLDVVTEFRTNFTGTIAIAGVADAGSGITVAFSSQPGNGTTGTFTVTVPLSTPPGVYSVTLTGSSTLPDVTKLFAVQVTAPAPPAFTFGVAPDPLNVVINHLPNYAYTVTLNRTAFTGAVTVSAVTDDAGLVVIPNPAPATSGTSVALTVSVLGGVSVGTHVLTLHGAASGYIDQVTPFSVIATLPAGGVPAGIVMLPTPGTLRVGSIQQYTAYLVDSVGNRTVPAAGWGIGILSDASAVTQDQTMPAFDAIQSWQTRPVRGVGVGTTLVRGFYYRLSDGTSTFAAIATINVTP